MTPLPNSSDSGFTLGGFLILAALGAFIWKGVPLDSVRPGSEKSAWYEHGQAHQVPARLWQDPFKVAYTHKQTIDPKPGDIANFEQILKPEIEQALQNHDLTVLMVLVSPGSYPVLEEQRRRRRYAVLSALGEENYVPRNSEVLSVYYQSKKCSDRKNKFLSHQNNLKSSDAIATILKGCEQGSSLKDNYSIPYEWSDYENWTNNDPKKHQVLVLWLDESQFIESPLRSVKELLEPLTNAKNPNNNNINASLIGPARSDTLRNLVTKDESKAYQWFHCNSNLATFNIFSATATVDDAELIPINNDKQKTDDSSPLSELKKKITGKACSKDNSKTSMNFLRTIQSDDALIKKLANELIEKRLVSNEHDHVVVISEMDTYFGRSLPRAFKKHFCKNNCNNNLVRYHYQRGIDGIIAGQKNSPSSLGAKQTKQNRQSQSIDLTSMRRPVGTGQYDYLRRLAVDIKQKDREWRLESGYGVRAVILLGSDVYDKLLILRALRPEFPAAVFATTDLDAQLMHPAEYTWTRNLIVASTYNLSLSLPVPMTTMPFRDSYQTSVYLATRLNFNEDLQYKVKHSQQTVKEIIPPQLLEIGRQKLIQLPDDEDNMQTWNRLQVKSYAPSTFMGLFLIAVLGILALHQLKPRAGRIVVVLGILLLVISLLTILISFKNIDGEPVTLLSGASIWPAEGIRLFSVILSLVFIWSVIHRLNRSWNALGFRYFGKGIEPDEEGITLTELWDDLKVKLGHPIESLKNIKSTEFFSALMILILIVVMSNVLPIKLPLWQKIIFLSAVWIFLFIFWWTLIYGHLSEKLHVLSVNEWVYKCVSDDKNAVDMWCTYCRYGAGDQRFLRTIAYILIYFAFASILFAILGAPDSPCRGEFACKIDKIILGFSVLSMLVLLFIVVDAARLCICWVDSMRKNDLDWSKTKKDEFVQSLKLSDKHTVAWMRVHLIGERTNEVTRLIYYPVLIILLLLLARSTYFDNWDFPQALAIIIGLNFIIALGSIVRLNYVAQSVRNDILRDLQDEKLADDRQKQEQYEPSSSERQELIHQLESLRIGAYLKVWEQPPVRATIMLLGGVALTYAEYMPLFLG